jgi:cation diffusion facilitator CzcD-associated flavoprotein CzcO
MTIILLSFSHSDFRDSSQVPRAANGHEVTKRIVIIGAGPSGVSTLKAFINDIPEQERQGWDIVLLEKRDNVGGIWYKQSFLTNSLHADGVDRGVNRYPDPDVPEAPGLPATPLYPDLRTNTPHPFSAQFASLLSIDEVLIGSSDSVAPRLSL